MTEKTEQKEVAEQEESPSMSSKDRMMDQSAVSEQGSEGSKCT